MARWINSGNSANRASRICPAKAQCRIQHALDQVIRRTHPAPTPDERPIGLAVSQFIAYTILPYILFVSQIRCLELVPVCSNSADLGGSTATSVCFCEAVFACWRVSY